MEFRRSNCRLALSTHAKQFEPFKLKNIFEKEEWINNIGLAHVGIVANLYLMFFSNFR